MGKEHTYKDLLKQIELLETENYSLKNKLENSERKYNSLLKNSPTGIVTIDREGEILSINDKLLELMGSPSTEETKKLNLFTFKPLVDVGVSNVFRECLETGENITSELPYVSKWGKSSYFRYSTAPIYDESGNITGVQATVEDFTHRIKIEDKLQKSKEHFRKITENMLDMVSITDDACNFTYISPGHIRTLGYTSTELIGKNAFDLLHPDDKEKILTIFTDKVASDTHGEGMFRFRHKNGNYIWVETTGRVLTNDDGSIDCLIFVSRDISERVKAENLLIESQKQFEAFVNSTSDLLFLKDNNFNHLLVNKKYAQFLGKKEEYILGKDDFELLPMELAKKCRKSDQEVLRKNKIIIVEETDQGRIYESKKFPVWTKDKLIGIGGLIRDVTTEKNAIKNLKTSEQRNRSLLDALPDIMFIFDLEGNFIDFYTHNTEKLLYAPSNFLNKNIKEVLPEYLANITLACIHELLKTNQPQVYSYDVPANNKIEYYEGRMVKCGENEILSIVRDVTEQVKAQKKIEESEQRFREFAQLLPEVAFEVNRKGNITFVNKLGVEKFGIEIDTLKNGINATSFFTEQSKPLLQKNFKKNLNGLHVSGREYEALTKYGKKFPCLIYISQIKEGNHIIGLRGILIDISNLKKAQSLENEMRITEKSAQLKQLFLANMSHEMRTPMNGILGMTEFLLETNLDEQQREYTNIIHSSSQNLLYLINDILDLSKIEQGEHKLAPVDFSLQTTIKEVLDNFSGLVNQKPLRIVTKFQDKFPETIYNDVNRVKQVLSNLISNAIKYTEKGEVKVESCFKKNLNNTYSISIDVADSGMGISKKNQEKIFSMFLRLDDSLTRSTEGTGLGLSIAKKIAELLQGSLTVESELGKGSKFNFSFTAGEPINSKTKYKNQEKEENYHIGLNILCAEDILVNQKVLELLLESMGCKVKMASNGKLLLKIYEEGKYDVILMDIMMPEMDGITAMKELRRRYDKLPPIIGVSANAMEGDAEKYIAEGMDDYIVKPVKRDLLFQKLSKLKKLNKNV